MYSFQDFNPHSHKGSDENEGIYVSDEYDFNPHSHKGSDVCDNAIVRGNAISIHTPTRGVTQGIANAGYAEDISIHTPTRGVTIDYLDANYVPENFNPHSHKGSDVYTIF